MEDIPIAQAPAPEEFPMFAIYCDDQLQDEEFVESEVNQLWSIQQCFATDIQSGQFRQRSVTNTLGQLLFTMKRNLSICGRAGKWSKWLRERRIPRASADRMVARYAEAFHLMTEIDSEAIPEPTEAQINALFASVWPRLNKTLTTPRSRYEFLRCFLYRSGLCYDWRDDGIMIFEPGHQPQGSEVIASEQQTMTADDQDGDVL